MTTATLKHLLVSISENDANAYKELFLLYYKRLVNFATLILKSKEHAEEVVSDVFMKVWLQRNNLGHVGNFHLYIYVITKNLSINRLLKEKKKQFSFEHDLPEWKEEERSPEDILITIEIKTQIDSAIRELPPRCRLIFLLVKEDGLKYKEVAELLELSIKTVENQMAIALKKIAQAIHFHPVSSLN